MSNTASSNTLRQQLGSYSAHQQQNESVRETEVRALLNCANRLAAAQDPKSGMEAYLDAIRQNQHLWTLFQVTIAETDNPLPRDLKLILLNLSRFVDKVSLRASAEYNPSLLTSLININKQIAAGLSVNNAAGAVMSSATAGAMPPVAAKSSAASAPGRSAYAQPAISVDAMDGSAAHTRTGGTFA